MDVIDNLNNMTELFTALPDMLQISILQYSQWAGWVQRQHSLGKTAAMGTRWWKWVEAGRGRLVHIWPAPSLASLVVWDRPAISGKKHSNDILLQPCHSTWIQLVKLTTYILQGNEELSDRKLSNSGHEVSCRVVTGTYIFCSPPALEDKYVSIDVLHL